jgi:hypothetical protein
MKRVVWKEADLVLLQLEDDLFTLGQMLRSPYMQFYHLQSRDGRFSEVVELKR